MTRIIVPKDYEYDLESFFKLKIGVNLEKLSSSALKAAIEKIKKEDPEFVKGAIGTASAALTGFIFFGPVGAGLGGFIGGLIAEKRMILKKECIESLEKIKSKLEKGKDIVYLTSEECETILKCLRKL